MYVNLAIPSSQSPYEQKHAEDDSKVQGIELMVHTHNGRIQVALPARTNLSAHHPTAVTVPHATLSLRSGSSQEPDLIQDTHSSHARHKQDNAQRAPTHIPFPKICYSSTPQSFCYRHQLRHLITHTALKLSFKTADDNYPGTFYKEAIGLGTYYEYRNLFDKTARELLHFFCYVQEPNQSNPTLAYIKKSASETPLYHNLIPYIEPDSDGNFVGKIGMIGIEDSLVFSSIHSITAACQHAIKYLPYQFDVILETAKAMIEQECASKIAASVLSEADARQQAHTAHADLASNHETFRAAQANTLRYFQLAYGCHRDFVSKHKITPENPDPYIPVHPNRVKEIQHFVVAYLHALHVHPHRGGFLGSNPDGTIERLEATFPILLDKTLAILRRTVARSIAQHCQEGALTSYASLLFARNVNFPFFEVQKDLSNLVVMLESSKDESSHKQALNMVLDGIFLALSGHEIAAYYPQFGRARSSSSKQRILA